MSTCRAERHSGGQRVRDDDAGGVGRGPLFVTTSVYVSVAPTVTGSGESVFTIDRSAAGGERVDVGRGIVGGVRVGERSRT